MSERYNVVFNGGVITHTSCHPVTPEGEEKFVQDMFLIYGKDVIKQIYRTWGDRKIIYEWKG